MLYDFIKSRLPKGYTIDLGNVGQKYDENGVPNHQVFNQFIRSDHEGDIGIFEVYNTLQKKYNNISSYISEVHIEVIVPNGHLETVKKYLKQLYINIRTNKVSDDLIVEKVQYISMEPMSQNESGKQWVVLNLLINYKVQE